MSIAPAEISATTLTHAQLIDLTEEVARDVRNGHYEIHADVQQRWHVRIRCDEQVDVWLISWTKDQGTQLHDHGGSSGAFTVVSGTLGEAAWSDIGCSLSENTRRAGDTVAFGESYVHDVRNLDEPTAVSVHAYSPPLSHMNYYDVENSGLIKLASVWTDDPESPAPDLGAPL